MNFWGKAKKFSPATCRMLARTRSKRPVLYTVDQIAKRSGLDLLVVSALATRRTWDGVPFDTMHAYLKGCDVDFCDRNRMRQHTRLIACKRKDKWRYVRESPEGMSLIKSLSERSDS